MNRVKRLAEIPAGSLTKWVVLGFWVVVLVIAFPLSSKLTGAEKNDAKAWLPASESPPRDEHEFAGGGQTGQVSLR